MDFRLGDFRTPKIFVRTKIMEWPQTQVSQMQERRFKV